MAALCGAPVPVPAPATPRGRGRLPHGRSRGDVRWSALDRRSRGVAVQGASEGAYDMDVGSKSDDGSHKTVVAVLCGGPSAERGISLNSARSVLDHLRGPGIDVQCFYLDRNLRAFQVDAKQMYSNTPSDFDFKLGRNVSESNQKLNQTTFADPESLAKHLYNQSAIVFPAIHGAFGEDGELQKILERNKVPFVGASSESATVAFDKFLCARKLFKNGFPVLFAEMLSYDECFEADEAIFETDNALRSTTPSGTSTSSAARTKIFHWFNSRGLDPDSSKVVVKPTRGGSSLGVSIAIGVDDALDKATELLKDNNETVLIELHANSGKEFTVVVVETNEGPVALTPTEIEVLGGEDGDDGDNSKSSKNSSSKVFNFRRKYLPTSQVVYHAPARFGTHGLQNVRREAVACFKTLGLRDFARLDGFFYEENDDAIEWPKDFEKSKNKNQPIFTDVNVVSGMEQTSFLFLQAAQVGLSHKQVLQGILANACTREGVHMSKIQTSSNTMESKPSKQKVYVLFGGDTSERQVSLLSGVNVFLKLRGLQEFDVTPVLLAPSSYAGMGKQSNRKQSTSLENTTVFCLPYDNLLRHTVEEVLFAAETKKEEGTVAMSLDIQEQLLQGGFMRTADMLLDSFDASPTTLGEAVSNWSSEKATVFNAVHGGCGEDGSLQTLLQKNNVRFTGSSAFASKVCMDKFLTGSTINESNIEGVSSCLKRKVTSWEMSETLKRHDKDSEHLESFWISLCSELKTDSGSGVCFKPNSDGCSTGVARLRSAEDLRAYALAVTRGHKTLTLPTNKSRPEPIAIEMPVPGTTFEFLAEPFVEAVAVTVCTDANGDETVRFIESIESGEVNNSGNRTHPRLVEITVGVYGDFGSMISMEPSLTVVESSSNILSLEEKFQGGTGVNITPPPSEIIKPEIVQGIKDRISKAANVLGVSGFARVDAFVDCNSGDVIIIECNTVPGMTPSTVLFHQAMALEPSVEPAEFLRDAVRRASEGRGRG